VALEEQDGAQAAGQVHIIGKKVFPRAELLETAVAHLRRDLRVERLANVAALRERSTATPIVPQPSRSTKSWAEARENFLRLSNAGLTETPAQTARRLELESSRGGVHKVINDYLRTAFGRPSKPLEAWRIAELNDASTPYGCVRLLGPLARNFLSIPATSAAVERLFSMAGRTLTSLRVGLKADQARGCMVLKQNKAFRDAEGAALPFR